MPVIPAYPLLPIAAIISSVLLLIILLTSAARNSWNLGVTVLCVCLFFENMLGGITMIIWANDAKIRYYALCDIASHIQLFATVAKPACTLVIARKLHRISSLRILDASPESIRLELWIDYMVALGLPTLVTAVLYYIVQANRFAIFEGYGCSDIISNGILPVLLTRSWGVVLPLISLVIYCPRLFINLFRYDKVSSEIFTKDEQISRGLFYRILAVGSLDIIATLPIGIYSVVIGVLNAIEGAKVLGLGLWYHGFSVVHSNWGPVSYPYSALTRRAMLNIGIGAWMSVVFAFLIFALFGLTSPVREVYWRAFCSVTAIFGWHPRLQGDRSLGRISFARNTKVTDVEQVISITRPGIASIISPDIDSPQMLSRSQGYPDSYRYDDDVLDITPQQR